MRIFMTVILFSTMMSAASADALYDKCINDDANGTEALQKQCGETYIERIDTELTRLWQEVYGAFDMPKGPGRNYSKRVQSVLMDAQRKWIAYRDASCKTYLSGYFSKEFRTRDYYVCRGEIVEQRIRDLRRFTTDKETNDSSDAVATAGQSGETNHNE